MHKELSSVKKSEHVISVYYTCCLLGSIGHSIIKHWLPQFFLV